MKNPILLIAAIICISGNTKAQIGLIDSRDKPHAGVKIGANLSNVYDAKGEVFYADSKFGLAAGGFVSIPMGKYLGVQPEILFSQKGFQASGSLFFNTYSFTRTTNFIDIPIFLAVKPIGFLTLLAGPQYSYLIKQKDVFSSKLSSYDVEQEFNNQDIRKNLLSFKAGFDINVTVLVFSARVGWDIQNNSINGISTVPRYKNAWYQATIGLRI